MLCSQQEQGFKLSWSARSFSNIFKWCLSFLSFDLFQAWFWLSKWVLKCSQLCWFVFCLSKTLLQNSLFVFLHPLSPFFFFFKFPDKPQVTPKPKIIIFWMRSSPMTSFWTWPSESSSSTASGAYAQSPSPIGSIEWQWAHTLQGGYLSMSKLLAKSSLYFS